MRGYRFKVTWPCTSYVMVVNATDPTAATQKLWRLRRFQQADTAYLGECEPLPADPEPVWLRPSQHPVRIRKVF